MSFICSSATYDNIILKMKKMDELFHEKPDFFQDRLKELLGHTPVQVIAGSVLGVTISWLARAAY